MTGEYTNVAAVYLRSPLVNTVSTITSEHVNLYVIQAEAEINATLARMYSTPIASGNALLGGIAAELTLYRLYSQRIFPDQKLKDSEWPDRFKEARDMLRDIASGKILLTDNTGVIIEASTDVAQVWSDTMDYIPTFSELDQSLNHLDVDKEEDLLDDRGSGIRDLLI